MKQLYALGILLSVCFTSFAQEGDLDLSFNGTGYRIMVPGNFTLPATGYAIAVQPDGKIVTAGPGRGVTSSGPQFMITRQLTTGAPDPTFGTNGIVYIDPEGADEDGAGTAAYGLAIAPDGKIVVVGALVSWYDFSPSLYWTTIVRLNSNGTRDNSFNDNGVLNISLNGETVNAFQGAWDVAVQPDNKIVITGISNSGTMDRMTIARFTPEGLLDNSFNGTGVVYANFPYSSQGYGLKLQPDGKIISVGRALNASNNYDIAVVRLNPDGSYDNSFDGDGKYTKDFNGGLDEATDVDVQTDGKIVVSGTAFLPAATPTLLRLTTTGSPDPSFDGDGIRPISIATNNSGQAVVAQSDGRIVWLVTTGTVFFIVKLNADGTTYNPFNFDGVAVYSYAGQGNGYDIALQSDGKIVATGFGQNAFGLPGQAPNVGRGITRILNFVGTVPVTITCPSSYQVNTGFNNTDNCTGLVPGLFAATNPESPYTYTLTGATTGSGNQSAPAIFNRGVTTVTYTVTGQPDKTCSFTVTVVDNKPPVLSCAPSISYCYNPTNNYIVAPVTPTDNCGVTSVSYTITGATVRSGNSTNASGTFNPGISIINWTAADAAGNISTCQQQMTVSGITANVADQYAVNPGGAANTIYLGYGSQSLTYTVTPSGGQAPYSYAWSNGSTGSTASFSTATAGTNTLSVTVTDSRGCSTTATKTIYVVDVRCGNKGANVSVCKPNGKSNTICVSPNAVAAQLATGAYLGACTSGRSSSDLLVEARLRASITPNPTSSQFELVIDATNKAEKVLVEVFDIAGRKLQQWKVSSETKLSIGDTYGSGTYLVQVSQKGETPVIHKLIKL